MSPDSTALLPHTCPGPQHLSIGAAGQGPPELHVAPRKSGPPAGEPNTTVSDVVCTQSYWQDITFVSKFNVHAVLNELPTNWHLCPSASQHDPLVGGGVVGVTVGRVGENLIGAVVAPRADCSTRRRCRLWVRMGVKEEKHTFNKMHWGIPPQDLLNF